MFSALLALSPARKIAAALGGAAVLIALGAGLAIAWEHKAPWGLEAKRAALAHSIDNPENGFRVQLRSMTASRNDWKAAEGRCAAARRKENAEAAQAVTTASDDRARANGSAFNQGYAAGRVAGLQTCGANRENPNPLPGPAPAADGVRDGGNDLAAAFGQGAYRPGSPLPGDR